MKLGKRGLWMVLPGLLGCSANGALSQNGNLGNGAFTYYCQSQLDQTCNCANNNLCIGGNPPFPSAIALGSQFGVRFSPATSINVNVGNPVLKPVAANYVQITGNVVVALKTGLAGIYAASSVDGSFVDFTVVNIVTPLSLSVLDAGGNPVVGPQKVTVGMPSTFSVVPLQAGGQELPGTLEGTWTTSDPAVAALTLGSPNDTMGISGVAPGTATITVSSSGNVQTTFTVEVM
jgi:hypothetical protein